MERLRPLVGSRGWDYCVFWKLNQDQSAIECVDCCCGGADVQYPQQEFDFTVSTICKDALFPHERSSSGACELLAQLPPSIALDSGIYAHTLLSNHPRWLNFASCSELNIREDTVGTKVLIPIAGGLIELFVAKQVPEDAQIIEFITAQCTGVVSMEGDMGNFPIMNNNNNTDHHQEGPENVVNLQQHDLFLPTRHNSSGLVHGELENDTSENSMMELQDNNNTQHIEFVEANMAKLGGISGSDVHVQVRRGGGRRSGSVSENEDEDQLQAGNNNEEEEEEKRPQSKNLVAERKRRKKLNDRLYTLRSLVPNISKLDRASIIGDAIEFIKELEKQQKDLQDELEEQSDIEDHHHHGINNQGQGGRRSNNMMINRQPSSSELVHTEQPTDHINKPQQMEPQVEVNQIDGKEFFVKVFCEHKAGGFVRLMEALDSIGLEVKNANITSFRSLVSSIFTVEKKDSEVIQADHVKDSLLEVTRNVGSPVGWRARGDHHHHINNNSTDADHLLVDPNPNHHHHYSLLHNHLIY